MQAIAFDVDTGVCRWVYDPNTPLVNNQILKATTSHGIAYENGVIYAPTGPNGIILAIDANKEKIIIWTIYYIVQFKVPR